MEPEKDNTHKKRHAKLSRKKVVVCLLVLLIGVAAGGYLYYTKSKDVAKDQGKAQVVPANIQKAVNFPIYYPDQKKLPQGYFLDINSFKNPEQGVVVYSVKGPNDKNLAFSIQEKPPADELGNFNKRYIPINRKVLTDTGTATQGAIGPQTVVSLPVDADNAWILVTGPSDIYATDSLAKILKSLKKD